MPPLSVLLIEPSSWLQTRLQDRLSEVSSVGSIFLSDSFAKGFQLLHEKCPDVLILDSSTINHLGLELISKSKRPKFLREIIILVNDAQDYYKDYCNKLGIHFILDKSFEIELLPDIIEGIRQLK